MKRLAPIAALLVITVLAVQPVLGGLPCLAGAPAPCAPGCPMHMSGMGSDCPMTASSAAGACPSDCCALAGLQEITQLAPPQQLSGAVSATLASSLLPPTVSAVAVRAARSADPFVSPPLYLLHRDFRI